MVRRRRRWTANSKSTSSVRPVRDIPAAFQTTTYGWTKRILRPTQDRRIYRWISDGMEVERGVTSRTFVVHFERYRKEPYFAI